MPTGYGDHMKRNTWFSLNRHEGEENPPPVETKPAPTEKTLTQADVDRVVADRLARERQKFADYDDLKSKAAKLAELEAANQSEAEKLAAKADAAEKKAADLIARTAKAEVKALADGFADRDDAVLMLGDLSQYVKDGDVDTDAIKTALADVLTKKPHLAAVTGPRNPQPDGSQGRGGTSGPEDFSKADKATFEAELAKFGLRPRST